MPYGLVGAWRYSDANQSCDYVFRDDGSFQAEVRFQESVLEFHGRWTVDHGMLRYEEVRDRFGRPAGGITEPDRLLTVQKDHFVIQAPDGTVRKYVRVR